MRWFDGLEGSINSFQVPCPLDSLLPMTMREGETLKSYSDRY